MQSNDKMIFAVGVPEHGDMQKGSFQNFKDGVRREVTHLAVSGFQDWVHQSFLSCIFHIFDIIPPQESKCYVGLSTNVSHFPAKLPKKILSF